MRRAILGYRAGDNFGDAVQSYAMLGLLGSRQSVTLVDRDDIGSFAPAEQTALLMNGWLLHRPDRFFLSPRVSLAMVGVHVSPARPMYSRYPPFADVLSECPSVQRVFRDAAPVGARDLYTLAALHDQGIDSYFAGCPTLTLQRKGLPSDGSVIAIDMPESVCDELERRLRRRIVRMSNRRDSSWRSTAALRDDVEPHLELLERAELVVTTRLHAALPAHALGAHTVFAPRDPSDPRYSGLADFLPVTMALSDVGRSPLSLFKSNSWAPSRDMNEQVGTIREAVGAALAGSALPGVHRGVGSDRLLVELERAALIYDRVNLPERRSLRRRAWLRRLGRRASK